MTLLFVGLGVTVIAIITTLLVVSRLNAGVGSKGAAACRRRDIIVTWMMASLQVIMAGFIASMFAALIIQFVDIGNIYSLAGCAIISMGFGSIVWSRILFKTRIYSYCFITVKQNWAVVVGNNFRYDKIPDDVDARAKMFARLALRELGQGVRGKLPWEVIVESINLRSEIIIGTIQDGKPLVCYTKDDIELMINYQVVITPLVGFLINLIRRNEAAIKAYFKGIFEQELIHWIRSLSEDEVFAALPELKEKFKCILGGSEKVSDDEMGWGAFTNDPQLISINRNPRYQQAAEGMKIGARMGAVIDEINDRFVGKPQPDPNLVLIAGARTVGNELSGVLLIPGAGPAISDVLAGVESAAKVGIKASK